MGPIAISFGIGSAAVFGIAALFSTRGNASVAGFLAFIWLTTNAWDMPTGSDAQLYLDTALGCLCGLLCLIVMRRESRALWPIVIFGLMATWIFVSAAYADDGRVLGPQVKLAYQVASNVLFGLALAVAALPGARHGCLVFRRWMPNRAHLRPRVRPGHGWGREAPDAISRRKAKAR